MKEIIIKKTDETLYYDKLDNGLELFFLPNKNSKSFYITLNVRFGSIDTDFKVKGKNYHVPNGVAHFLEHLMFNEPDGSTAHEYFAKLGSSCNAATSFDYTFYEVSSINQFKENLEYIIDYVYRPYFTDQTVASEKGIIIEEIKMGESSPFRELFFNSKANVYHQSHYKNLISGSIDDVKKITTKDIQLCYDTFYHPQNMFLVITGNFNPYEAKAIVAEKMLAKKFNKFNLITKPNIKEPLQVVKEYDEKAMNVLIPKVTFSIKLTQSLFKKIDRLKLIVYLNILLNLKFGSTSLLKEKLLDNNLISDTINTSIHIGDNIVLLTLTFESMYPNEVIELVKQEFFNLKIEAKDLRRKAKVEISNTILHFDDIFLVNENIQNQLFEYNHYYENIIDIYDNLSIKEFNEIINRIDINNNSTYVIKPIKNDQ